MYSAISTNKRNTYIIMLGFVLLIASLGWIISLYYRSTGIFWGVLIGATIYALVQYFIADKLALMSNGARQIQKSDNPELFRIVENLSITDGLPMPKVYIIDDPSPNAFATGRDPNHASVTVTTGLLDIMSKPELEGVIAHELGHVKNYDIRVMMIVFGLVSVIGFLADMMIRMTWFTGGNRDDREESSSSPIFLVLMIAAAIITPIIAMLIQLAISRQREYLADATGAMTTRYPEGLASALAKIEQFGSPLQRQNPSSSHLFFANPLKKSAFSSLMSTHPSIPDRIARLQNMGSRL
jgi:heat shock protein HtpX